MKRVPLSIIVKLFVSLAILGILFEIIGICIGNSAGLIVIVMGWLALIGAIICMALFYRCPHCGGHLGRTWYHNRYCPHCGYYLV